MLTGLDDARTYVLHSITKQASKAKDRLDHRPVIEITNHLIHHSLQEVREALAELQDEGLIWRETSSKGEGWAVNPQAVDNLVEDLGISLESQKSRDFSLTNPPWGGVASHQGCGTVGVSLESAIRPTEGNGSVPSGTLTSTSYSSIADANLRTQPGFTARTAVRAIKGAYIEKKTHTAADPDSPYGLAQYFGDSAREAGFVWGDCNRKGLMFWFKEAKEAGMSPADARKLIDLFWMHPEVIRGAGKPAWQLFLAQREALAKQAGIRSHRPVVRAPEQHTVEEMATEHERILAEAYGPPAVPMTLEEIEAEHKRILDEAYGRA